MAILRRYKVAEHLFAVEADERANIWGWMEESYSPFTSNSIDNKLLFRVSLLKTMFSINNVPCIFTNKGSADQGDIEFSAYRGQEGYYFEFSQPTSSIINGCLFISSDYKLAKLALEGSSLEQWLTFNTAVSYCYLLASANHNTLLAHASCVIYKGKAYLFIGKSGTGKSTHSQLWLNSVDNVTLLNDDHPVIRLGENNEVIAYGSPWSGKTKCYKNLQAPVGGIIRISRAQHNKAKRLSIIESYASLITSFSGMTWEKELADGRDYTIQKVIGSVPCWVMECLPNEDAARVCSAAVTALQL